MKVKKFNNLWTMGIILMGAMLLFVFALKFISPELVIEIAHIESIVKIGRYIDTHKWAWYIASFLLSYFVYYLLCCACCSKPKLNLKENAIIILTIIILYLIKDFLPTYYMTINYISIILLPCIMKGSFAKTVMYFTITNLMQIITLEIRNLSIMIIDFNYATLLILMIDYYISLVLLYFAFNYKKRE